MSLKDVVESSSGYQAAKAEGARRVLLALGTKLIGEPHSDIRARLETMQHPDLLLPLATKLFHVASWEELLGAE